ncbi:hypothetical protein [Agrococcus sp. TF02-05]|uniref:hypothetical protein n=1 Tax=Agrococcus sp. TF02-05 TaxID=2815211 RepID=UPI001AA1A930|nr:hypothetical protein [Agrococcus sp. TF02-05]MBO1769669.1 hypothetical protein [Agrococcus sp. TF02-05]
MVQPRGRDVAARVVALWTLAIGFGASVLVGLSPTSWLQARLRYACAFEAEEWVCDGNAALLAAGASSLVLSTLALGGIALIVRATWDRVRMRAERFGWIALIAVLPTLILCAVLLLDAATHEPADVGIDDSRLAMWIESAMIPALATAVAGVLAGSGLRMRARGRPRRVAFVTILPAFALLLVAAVISFLGTLPTGIVAASAIGAGWYLAAAAWPGAPKQIVGDVDPGRSRSTS